MTDKKEIKDGFDKINDADLEEVGGGRGFIANSENPTVQKQNYLTSLNIASAKEDTNKIISGPESN